jgi:hypothetical protein
VILTGVQTNENLAPLLTTARKDGGMGTVVRARQRNMTGYVAIARHKNNFGGTIARARTTGVSMEPHDPNDGKIREGEPPYQPSDGAKQGASLRESFFLLIAVAMCIPVGALGFYLGHYLFHQPGRGGPHSGPNLSGYFAGLICGVVGFFLPFVVLIFVPRKKN